MPIPHLKPALSLTHDLLRVLSMDAWWTSGYELKQKKLHCAPAQGPLIKRTKPVRATVAGVYKVGDRSPQWSARRLLQRHSRPRRRQEANSWHSPCTACRRPADHSTRGTCACEGRALALRLRSPPHLPAPPISEMRHCLALHLHEAIRGPCRPKPDTPPA